MEEKKVFTDEQRIVALQNELRDVKQLLRESEAKRAAAEQEVCDLKLTVQEMVGLTSPSTSSPSPQKFSSAAPANRSAVPPAPNTAGRTTAETEKPRGGAPTTSDKARATILKLRMERVEQLRRQQQGDIKRAGLVCATMLANFRKEWAVFKEAFVFQLERTEKTLISVIADVSPQAHAAVAAVLHPPISSTHPVAKEINGLCDSMDSVVQVLQMQWYTFGCFSNGPVPVVGQSRRYLDPVVNVATYTQLGEKLRTYVEFASAVNLIKSELRLPNLMQHTGVAVMAANAQFGVKLDQLFDSIRLIRSPFNNHGRTLSLALRIALTVDVSREEIQRQLERFDRLAKRHTQRCFQYICHTVCIGRRFAKVLQGVQASRMRRYNEEELESMAIEMQTAQMVKNIPLTDVSGKPCARCGVPMYCEDCSLTSSKDGELATLLEERRSLMVAFTARRVEHFSALCALIDDTLKIMKRYKLSAPSLKSTKPTRQAQAETTEIAEKARVLASFVFNAERQLKRAATRRMLVPSSTEDTRSPPSVALSADQAVVPIDWCSQPTSGPTRPEVTPPPAVPEPPRPLVGPFGETVFPAEFYFKRRRAHTAQEERRHVMLQNAAVLHEISSGTVLSKSTPKKTSGRGPTSSPVTTGGTSPRVTKEPAYLSSRLVPTFPSLTDSQSRRPQSSPRSQ